MYPGYPQIDAAKLPEGSKVFRNQDLLLIDDDTHPVYFDKVEGAASIAQGIEQSGGKPVFGSSWSELDNLLEANGGVIAHGHITERWRNRFGRRNIDSEA
jgi:hypothetical protein